MRYSGLLETLRKFVVQIGVSTLACRILANGGNECLGSSRSNVDPPTLFIPSDSHLVEMSGLSRLTIHPRASQVTRLGRAEEFTRSCAGVPAGYAVGTPQRGPHSE